MHELIKLSARQVVNMLKRGEVSPLELIDVAGKRIAAILHRKDISLSFFLQFASQQSQIKVSTPE